MAKFTSKNIEFQDGQKAVFGTDDDSTIFWDGYLNDLRLTTTISGVDPIEGYHLTTKQYVLNESHPKYYIEVGLHIEVGDWGQYVIHDTGYIEVAGTLELGEGGMLIIQGV